MDLLKNGEITEVFLLITTAPFKYNGDDFVILIMEDFEEIAEINKLIPICSRCKVIRNGDQALQKLEQYFNKEWGMGFSHGLCPDCLEKELDKIREHKKKP